MGNNRDGFNGLGFNSLEKVYLFYTNEDFIVPLNLEWI